MRRAGRGEICKVAEALTARADEVFTSSPTIEPVDVLADKLPG
jgi:hypothetical protein